MAAVAVAMATHRMADDCAVGATRTTTRMIARAEPGALEDRLPRARRHEAAEPRRDEAANGAREHGDGRRARRQAQTESLQRDTAGRRLKNERDDVDCRIIESKEAQELIAGSNRFDCPRFEQIVQQRGARGAQQDEHDEMPQVWRLRDQPRLDRVTAGAGGGSRYSRSTALRSHAAKRGHRNTVRSWTPPRTSSMAGAPQVAATRSDTRAPTGTARRSRQTGFE